MRVSFGAVHLERGKKERKGTPLVSLRKQMGLIICAYENPIYNAAHFTL